MEKFMILVSLLSVFLPAAYSHSWPYDSYYFAEAALDDAFSESPLQINDQCVNTAQNEYKNKIINISTTLEALQQKVEELIVNEIPCPLPLSCEEILRRNPYARSGKYKIQKPGPDCSKVEVICNMTLNCSGVIGGWMQVINVDKRRRDDVCPPGTKDLTVNGTKLCGNGKNDNGEPGCSITNLSVKGIQYREVCGKIIAYEYGSPDAFGYYQQRSTQCNASTTIDGAYVDGISLTYDMPRQHIWTFAGGLNEDTDIHPEFKCPCTKKALDAGAVSAPSFVGDDYFCETGVRNTHWDLEFHHADPLWDGKGCKNFDYCCKQRTTTPTWFRKQLYKSTTADIEMRMCRDDGKSESSGGTYHNDPKHTDPDHADPNKHKVLNNKNINFDEDTPFEQLAIYIR